MQRAGYGREDIQALRAAYQVLFASGGTLSERVDETAERFGGSGPVNDVIAFIRADSTRAICQPNDAAGA
jgi:UDP-N-acetylglucosamine acyltransferase